MAKNYQWRTSSDIISGGYAGEETGVIPPDTGWRTTDVLSGSSDAEYYFRDSDIGQNSDSSRVVVSIMETWTASINSKNYLTVTLKTIVTGIRRDDIRGSAGTMGVGRDMYMRRENGGPLIWSVLNDPINTAHTILGSPITLDDYTFTLAPGQNLSRGSIYFRSNTQGHGGDIPPSEYIDLMWLGTEFRNILPEDYRPGATLDTNINVWKSHNRTNGACHILSNTSGNSWHECRTIGNGDIFGDPPSIYHSAKWFNQRLLGKED